MAMSDHLRTFRNAAWLGWQMESNWTRPWLFLIYSIARPIAATLILVLMFVIVKQDVASDPALFSFVYLGAAFYMFVAQVLFGVTYVIHEDREHYQTLKQVYIAPMSFYVYIIGRAMSKLVLTSLSVVISIAFGMVALGLPLDLGQVDWPLFALAMAHRPGVHPHHRHRPGGGLFPHREAQRRHQRGHRRGVLPLLRNGLSHHCSADLGAGPRSVHTHHLLA